MVEVLLLLILLLSMSLGLNINKKKLTDRLLLANMSYLKKRIDIYFVFSLSQKRQSKNGKFVRGPSGEIIGT